MKIRVYYEDTDCGNVVYYANYFRYMERSRTEYMRQQGVEPALFHEKGYIFAVTNAQIKYRHPARYDDLLEVESWISETSSMTFTFETTIHNQQGHLCAAGNTRLVCISAKTGKACKVPKELIAALQKDIVPPGQMQV